MIARRSDVDDGRDRPAGGGWRRITRLASVAGLGLTGVTLALAYAYGRAHPSCGGAVETAPDWTETVAKIALVTALASAALGLVGLLDRRWVAALVCVVVNPVALVGMALSSCAFY